MLVAKLDGGRILGPFFGPFLILLNCHPGYLACAALLPCWPLEA